MKLSSLKASLALGLQIPSSWNHTPYTLQVHGPRTARKVIQAPL